MKCDRSLYEQMKYIMNACTIAHVHVQLKLDTVFVFQIHVPIRQTLIF